MENIAVEQDTPIPLGQLVRMTGPVFMFGVILPFVDMVTDLRMIIRLYKGVPGCNANSTFHALFPDHLSQNLEKYCQDNPGNCSTEKHPIFASMLLGKYNLILDLLLKMLF